MEKKNVSKGDIAIGQRIRKIREEKSMTQKKLAEKVMVSPSSITRLESGQTMVSVFTIIKIAEVLNTSISFLLSGDEDDLNSKGQILRPTPNTAPLICGACYNTQPEDLLTMA